MKWTDYGKLKPPYSPPVYRRLGHYAVSAQTSPPEHQRRLAHMLHEKAAEIRRILETQVIRNLAHGHGRIKQKALGLEHQPTMGDLKRRFARHFAACPMQGAFGHCQ